MPRKVAVALSAVVVVATPVVLTGNALWLMVNPWLIDAQYALPGFPADPEGLEEPQRSELAKTGVRSIRPGGDGVALLREARLPGGGPAFDAGEVRHMEDVRSVVAGALIAWAVALACAPAAGLALRRLAGSAPLRVALVRGGLLSLGAIALLGLVMAIDFEAFFDAFHGVFFTGETWRFEQGSTLLRLYPEAFWAIAGAAMAVLIALQAVAVAALMRPTATARAGNRPRAEPS